MANERRIDSVIVNEAIQQELQLLKTGLSDAATLIKNFPQIKALFENADNVKKLSQANNELAESQKKIKTSTDQIAASEEKLKGLYTEEARQIAALKAQIQQQNKELSQSAKLKLAEAGSNQRLDATIAVLTTKLNKLNQTTEEGKAKAEKYKIAIDRLFDLRKGNADSKTAQSLNVGNYERSAKIIVDALEKEKQKLEELEKTRVRVQNAGASYSPAASSGSSINRTTITGFAGGGALSGIQQGASAANKELEQLDIQIANSRKVIEGFTRVTEQKSFLNLAGDAVDATQEFKALQKALINLERDGLGNTEGANKLRKELAELKYQISDTKAEIKALSSNTRSFDLFAGSVSFLADAFQTAAGAATLFGASEEDVAETIKTLIAIQTLANGVKGIANELTTRGTAANKVYAFAQNQVSIAMDSTAAAGARLRAAVLSIGIGALIIGIGLLISNFEKIKDAILGTTRAQKLLNESQKEYNKGITEAIQKVNDVKVAFDLAKQGVISKDEALKKYNDTLGDAFGKTNDLLTAEKNVAEKAEAYIKITGLKAQANALFALSAQQTAKALTASNEDNVGFFDKIKAGFKGYFGDYKGALETTLEAQKEGTKEAQETANANADILKNQGESLLKQAADLAKSFNIVTQSGQSGINKSSSSIQAQKQQLSEKINTEFDIYKLGQERKIRLLDEEINNDRTHYLDKITLLGQFIKESTDLVDEQEKYDIKKINDKLSRDKKNLEDEKKKKGADVAGINAEIKRLTENAEQEINLVVANAKNKRLEIEDNFGKRKKEIQQNQLDVSKQFADQEVEYEEFTNNVIKKINEGRSKSYLDLQKRQLEQTQELENIRAEIIKKSAAGIEDILFTALKNRNDAKQKELDDDIARIDARTQKEIEAINNSALSEEEKRKKINDIEKQSVFDKENIEKKKADLEKKRKAIEKTSALATIATETATSIFDIQRKAAQARAQAALLAANPATAAYAPAAFASSALILAQIPSVLAGAAIGLAKIAFFKDGTDYAPKGRAVYGEEGRELVIPPIGRPYLSPAVPTLTNLMGGEKIFNADITRDVLNAIGFTQSLALNGLLTQPIQIDNTDLLEEAVYQLRSLNKKPPLILQVQDGLEATAWYNNNFKN